MAFVANVFLLSAQIVGLCSSQGNSPRMLTMIVLIVCSCCEFYHFVQIWSYPSSGKMVVWELPLAHKLVGAFPYSCYISIPKSFCIFLTKPSARLLCCDDSVAMLSMIIFVVCSCCEFYHFLQIWRYPSSGKMVVWKLPLRNYLYSRVRLCITSKSWRHCMAISCWIPFDETVILYTFG